MVSSRLTLEWELESRLVQFQSPKLLLPCFPGSVLSCWVPAFALVVNGGQHTVLSVAPLIVRWPINPGLTFKSP